MSKIPLQAEADVNNLNGLTQSETPPIWTEVYPPLFAKINEEVKLAGLKPGASHLSCA